MSEAAGFVKSCGAVGEADLLGVDDELGASMDATA